MPFVAILLPALALAAHSAPFPIQDGDADRDVVCYAYEASEAAAARDAGKTDELNQRLQWTMFFRGVASVRFPGGAFVGERARAIKDLGLALQNDGKDLVEAECQARMRVAMNTGG